MPRELGLSEQDRSIRMSLAIIIAVILVIAAVSIFISISHQLINEFLSSSWPSAQATVTWSGLNSHFNPEIQYSYQVSGTMYTGKIVYCASKHESCTYNQKMNDLNIYPHGSPITIFYDPNNPEHKTLHPGLSLFELLGLGLVALASSSVLLMGAWAMLKDFQKVKNARFEDGVYYIEVREQT